MAGITFPPELTTELTKMNTPVSSRYHNSQIENLEKRDQFMLDFLSKFDAIPIGTLMPTTIDYTNTTIPDGWKFANGQELEAIEYPKLYALIKDSMLSPEEYLAYVHDLPEEYNEYKNVTAIHPDLFVTIPCGYYVHTSGSDKDDIANVKFRIPNLKDVYIRSSGNTDLYNGTIPGSYLGDTIRTHTHDMVAYPTNGVNLDTEMQKRGILDENNLTHETIIGANGEIIDNKIGVALTDHISNNYTDLAELGHKFRTLNNKDSYTDSRHEDGYYDKNETRPKTIVYKFMLKVEFKNPFSDGGNVLTDANSVNEYVPSETPPLEGYPNEKLIPVPDHTTGKIDLNWFDLSALKEAVVDAASSDILSMISKYSVIKQDIVDEDTSTIQYSSDATFYPHETTSPGVSVPVANPDGKISENYLNILTNQELKDIMFPEIDESLL